MGWLHIWTRGLPLKKGEVRHEGRRVELWSNNFHKSVVLLTNNFELDVKDIEEIYKRRWVIEALC